VNIGSRIKNLRLEHGLSQEELGGKTAENKMRAMPGNRKILLLVIAILLLTGYALWNMSLPNDMKLHKGCVYRDSLAGSVVEVKVKHHETSDPWRCYFGTKAKHDEVMESFRSQDVVLDITDLSNKEDNADRFLLKIDSDLGVLYQELYDYHAPLPKYKRENTYVLQDSIKTVYKNEAEFDILFPCGLLDYHVADLADDANELWTENKTWRYQDSFLKEDKSIIDFLLMFYNETDLYHATAEDSKIFVTFDRDALDGKKLNKYQRMRMEHFYKGTFAIEIDAEAKTLIIKLKDI